MDHKDLLKKYIKHVYEVEGSMFLPSAGKNEASNIFFTEEEIKELEFLSEDK